MGVRSYVSRAAGAAAVTLAVAGCFGPTQKGYEQDLARYDQDRKEFIQRRENFLADVCAQGVSATSQIYDLPVVVSGTGLSATRKFESLVSAAQKDPKKETYGLGLDKPNAVISVLNDLSLSAYKEGKHDLATQLRTAASDVPTRQSELETAAETLAARREELEETKAVLEARRKKTGSAYDPTKGIDDLKLK